MSEGEAAPGKDSGLEASITGFWLSSAPDMLDEARQTTSFSGLQVLYLSPLVD